MTQMAVRMPTKLRPPEFAVSGSYHYDAADPTGYNREHWMRAQTLSASAAHSHELRRVLRDRSRYEIANNTYASGMLDTLAGDVIGTGPRLQLRLDDHARAEAIEALWVEWCNEIDLGQLLFVSHFSESESGEVFLRPYLDMDLETVPLGVEAIEADRVTDDAFRQNRRGGEVDGIRYDSRGKPVSYRVMHGHPGDMLPEFGSTVFDAKHIIHLFRPTRPGQQRGIPRLTSALNILAEHRRYVAAVLAAAESSASHALVVKTDAPVGEDGQPQAEAIEALDTIEFERGMATTLPEGWDIRGFSPTQPTTNHVEFTNNMVKVAARCLNMPANIALGDSSNYNYSSGRLDWQTYEHSNRRDRRRYEIRALDRLFAAFLSMALIDPDSPVTTELARLGSRVPHSYMWSARGHVDPVKEASGIDTRLKNHTTTLADVYAAAGQDWETQLAQRARELDRMRELGIPVETAVDEQSTEETDDDEVPPARR